MDQELREYLGEQAGYFDGPPDLSDVTQATAPPKLVTQQKSSGEVVQATAPPKLATNAAPSQERVFIPDVILPRAPAKSSATASASTSGGSSVPTSSAPASSDPVRYVPAQTPVEAGIPADAPPPPVFIKDENGFEIDSRTTRAGTGGSGFLLGAGLLALLAVWMMSGDEK